VPHSAAVLWIIYFTCNLNSSLQRILEVKLRMVHMHETSGSRSLSQATAKSSYFFVAGSKIIAGQDVVIIYKTFLRKRQYMKLFGGIEAGGTKFVCMAGNDPDHLLKEVRFPTTTPRETVDRAIEFFLPYVESGQLSAIGIASFGPVDLSFDSPTYGHITTTPKPGWSQTDLYGEIQRSLGVPVAFDTDVNAAAFGEQYWISENRSLDPFVYVTVGTGIGVGVVINGAPLHGLMHGEAGHSAIPHDWQRDPFPGVCPYHGDCLEGLASGLSMRQRWAQSPECLPDSHPGWDLESDYIAFALVNLIYAYAPKKIILGGGVSQHPGFHKAVYEKVVNIIHGYIQSAWLSDKIGEYIRPPALGNRSGALGAIAMACALETSGELSLCKR
jgi:fructokinase